LNQSVKVSLNYLVFKQTTQKIISKKRKRELRQKKTKGRRLSVPSCEGCFFPNESSLSK
jgi:hypothetical protein